MLFLSLRNTHFRKKNWSLIETQKILFHKKGFSVITSNNIYMTEQNNKKTTFVKYQTLYKLQSGVVAVRDATKWA